LLRPAARSTKHCLGASQALRSCNPFVDTRKPPSCAAFLRSSLTAPPTQPRSADRAHTPRSTLHWMGSRCWRLRKTCAGDRGDGDESKRLAEGGLPPYRALTDQAPTTARPPTTAVQSVSEFASQFALSSNSLAARDACTSLRDVESQSTIMCACTFVATSTTMCACTFVATMHVFSQRCVASLKTDAIYLAHARTCSPALLLPLSLSSPSLPHFLNSSHQLLTTRPT